MGKGHVKVREGWRKSVQMMEIGDYIVNYMTET
jgi:hypothetical protein